MVDFSVLPDGFLVADGFRARAAFGRRGLTADKTEGDGATPRGTLPLLRVLYRADRIAPPRCAVPLEPIGRQDGWCDDPADAAYNRPVKLPYAASHEQLWRGDALYDVVGVLGWNVSPVARGAGSAIFLHLATKDYAPTAGCIALALPDLLACLAAGLTSIRI